MLPFGSPLPSFCTPGTGFVPPFPVSLPLVTLWCLELNIRISRIVLGAGCSLVELCETVLAVGGDRLDVGH